MGDELLTSNGSPNKRSEVNYQGLLKGLHHDLQLRLQIGVLVKLIVLNDY